MKKVWGYLIVSLCAFLQVSVAQKQGSFAQLYQPRFEKGTIKAFLDDINHTLKVNIEYSSNCIDTNKLVVLNGSSSTLGSVLKQVLKDQKIGVVEKNNKIILIPSVTSLPENAFSYSYSIFGFIKEASSKEPLSDASVVQGSYRTGCVSNAYGFYSMELLEGKQSILISYAGYKSQKIEVLLQGNTRIDIELVPNSEVEEVVITSANNKKSSNGVENINLEDNPNNVIIGESDAVRSLYLLPGVNSIPEISNGMLVRGGNPDQNVLLLDGNQIFNPTHLLGTLSIVNKTSLKSLHLYKSSFPSRFGGALSSFIDVATKDGNMEKWKGEANAGLLAGSFTVEGPLKKDKTAVMLSFRRSWVNPFLHLMHSGIEVNFYDIHFKCTQMIGSKNKLMLNFYGGQDQLDLLQDIINNRQQWGNKALSLAWNRLLAPRAFVNSSLNMTSYNNIGGFRYSMYDSTGVKKSNRVYNTFSSIQQINARTEVELYSSNSVRFNIGAKFSYTRIKPFNTNVSSDFLDNPNDFGAFPPLSFKESILYYENEIKVNKKLFIRPGIHLSWFQYKKFHYTSWQPRLYAGYKLSAAHQLDLSYNHLTQYLHLVTNPYLGINSDAWVPSTAVLRPEESDLINLGYTYHGKKSVTVGAEAYFKNMKNVTNYVEGKNLFLNNADWEHNVQSGKGWSYGLELKTVKKALKWQAQAGYTLSWNWRQFREINNGYKAPFKYDRRHCLNMAVTYLHNRHWDVSGLWTFASGDVYTLPDRIYADFDVAQQIVDPLAPKEYRLIYHSSTNNQYRTLPYHRMDISCGFHHVVKKNTKSLLTMGVYNLYGSPSQYVYNLEGTVGKKSLVVTSQYKFFSITPFISYSFTF